MQMFAASDRPRSWNEWQKMAWRLKPQYEDFPDPDEVNIQAYLSQLRTECMTQVHGPDWKKMVAQPPLKVRRSNFPPARPAREEEPEVQEHPLPEPARRNIAARFAADGAAEWRAGGGGTTTTVRVTVSSATGTGIAGGVLSVDAPVGMLALESGWHDAEFDRFETTFVTS